jgi:threonine aldolase
MIDLRSDTVTRPTPAMREAMLNAELGDDVLDGDPTVQRLEETVAARLGKDAALFFPSGTMANQCALWASGERGTELLLDHRAHILDWEQAGAAALSGLQVRPVVPAGAHLMADDLRAALRQPSKHAPRSSLLALENTLNGGGGSILPLGDMRALADIAREHGLRVHLDGARLWNAHIASGHTLRDLASPADTVMVCFSKGLGAPVGSLLAGTSALIGRAWEIRKRLGGGMRQSGLLAAAALFALEHQLDRMTIDHAHAAQFAARVNGVGGAVVAAPETNIVMIDLPAPRTSVAFVAAASARGVALSPWNATRVRAVFHLDVSGTDVLAASEVVSDLLQTG